MIVLSQESKALFEEMAQEAQNWNGTPLLPVLSRAQKGNLTDLKRKGLVFTEDDGDGFQWVFFTSAGKNVAHELGIACTSWIQGPFPSEVS